MAKKEITGRNLAAILIKIGALCMDDAEIEAFFIDVLGRACDHARNETLFGLEGQLDPREDAIG